MATKHSAGLLVYRQTATELEVLLAHPGGPFFKNRDDGAWTIPKGLVEPHESALETALREFQEETGFVPPPDPPQPLGTVTQKGGKQVEAWATAADFDLTKLASNSFEIEWPPHSGRRQSFPEIDRAEYFSLATARTKILPAQQPFLDRLLDWLSGS